MNDLNKFSLMGDEDISYHERFLLLEHSIKDIQIILKELEERITETAGK